MNDFIKKLLEGIPQTQDYVSIEENDPYLDPKILPSPLMTPLEATNKNVNLRPSEPTLNIPKTENKPVQKQNNTNNSQEQSPVQQPQVLNAAIPKTPSLQELLGQMKTDQDQELLDAQKSNQDFIRNVLLARAGNEIGSAIAGVEADKNFGQDFIDLANKKVSDLQESRKAARDARNQKISELKSDLDIKRAMLELGDKEKEIDPNSDVSKAFRTLITDDLKAAGINLPIGDSLSYDNLKKLYPSFVNRITNKNTSDRALTEASLKKEERKELAEAKKKEKNLLYGDKIAEKLEKIMDRKDKAERIKRSVQEAIKNPSGFRDIQAIYDFVKNMDPDSAVREGEISLAQSTLPAWKKLQLQVDGNLNGDVQSLTPKLRNELVKIADEVIQGIDKTLQSKLERQRKVASQLGIDEQYWNRMYKSPEMIEAEKQAEQEVSKPNYDNDKRIDAFMKRNNITDRNKAIEILKKENILK